MFSFAHSEWVEASFLKRECVKIIPSSKDSNRCCCGLAVNAHHFRSFGFSKSDLTGTSPQNDPRLIPNEHWNPSKHTLTFPTDAYGCIDFRGSHTNKAQYIRLAHDTKPELVLNLLLREWCLEKPKLLITVNGGKANFEIQPKLKRSLRKGLLKAAKTTGAWILTSGTNTGVSKHVGDALVSEKSPRIKGGRVVSIGITPWGIVDKRNELLGKKTDVPFHSVSQPRSRFATLNKHHAYFLLVDNGTVGKYGAEIALRRKLEKFISTQFLGNTPQSYFCTPLVCLVIEGGTNTIRSVLEYVTATPPVPVVICDGTGRAADLLAFAHKYVGEDGNDLLTDYVDHLNATIMKTFDINLEQAARLQMELRQCVRKKNLLTIYRCSNDRDQTSELDEVIMTALFKAQHLSPVEQLSLALAWNRCDIAKKEIFIYGQEWPLGALDHAMFEALDNDRVDFVRLLLDHGVNMHKFLTVVNLEELYNSKNGPANTLGYLVRDVVPRMTRGYRFTLVDIGLVIGQLMGSGYVATYSRRKFRTTFQAAQPAQPANSPCKSAVEKATTVRLVNGTNLLHASLQKSLTSHTLKIPSFMSSLSANGGPGGLNPGSSCDEPQTFDYPFSELIVWAVLTKRQEMAKLMWQHGEQAMSKSLVAARLYQAMANEAADDDLDVEIYDELKSYSKYFEDLSLQLLEYCYQADDELTQHLLTASLENWSRQTCLRLAVYGNNLRFLSHPLSQVILADLWMGGLRMRKNPGFKIILGLLIPPTIAKLEFKTREELELMPQTEEELQDRDDSDSNSSASSSSAASRRSSIHANDMDSLSSLELGAGRNHGRKRVDTDCDEGGPGGDGGRGPGGEGGRPSGKPYHHHRRYSLGASSQENSALFGNEQPFNSYGSRMDLTYKKKTRPLKLKKKLYEFYAAPITKYFCHSIAFVVFLAVYTYLCLVKTPVEPSWPEIYVASCMINFGAEKVRSIFAKEPSSFLRKIRIWAAETRWNLFDVIGILVFLGAFIWRCVDTHFVPYAHVTYATDICYWYIRSLRPLGVNKYFGPYVMMIGRMIENMMYFVVLLLVVLMAFGVCRQGILFPNEEPHWRLVRHIFYQPYFMLYGEVFAPDIDPECNEDCTEYGQCGEAIDGTLLVPCHIGRWITPIVMTIYLLVANILLLNLLIASFNTIYNSVNSISHQIWNFERFSVVIEYEEKPILPAPFTLMSHAYRIFKFCHRQCKGLTTRFETGLKLVLSKYDMERLYDFEEECVDGLMQSKETDSMQRTDARIKTTLDIVEELRSKMEDFERWEINNQEAASSTEYRLQRMEEIAEQTLSNLSVIHRFMTTQHGSIESDFEKVGIARSRDSSPFFDEKLSRPIQSRAAQVQDSIKPRKPFPRRDTSESMQPEFCDEEIIPPLSPLIVIEPTKVEQEMDKVRFHLESEDEDKEDEPDVSADAENVQLPLLQRSDSEKKKFESDKKQQEQAEKEKEKFTLKKNKSGGRRNRKVRHASSGGSSGDVFTTKSKLSSLRRRSRRATESSRTSDEEMFSIRNRRKRNLSEEVQEADEIRHLDSEFDERENNFTEMKITLTGPSRNPTLSSKTDENSDKSSATTATQNFRLIAAASRHRRIQSRKRRDYTSITDELEQMIAVSPLPDRRSPGITLSSRRHANNESVEIETEHLHDAEEADYNLMEALITQRLRRSSANLQASFEDLVTRSIREDSSPSSVTGEPEKVNDVTNLENDDFVADLEHIDLDDELEPAVTNAILHQQSTRDSSDVAQEVPVVIVSQESDRALMLVSDQLPTNKKGQTTANVDETKC